MKTSYVLQAICGIALALALLLLLSPAPAADGRTIIENGTNIYAIGIDSRDFDVVRFYLRGTNVLELRGDRILHVDRVLLPPPPDPALTAERASLIAAVNKATNATDFTALSAPTLISNLVRLRQLEEKIASPTAGR